MRSDFGPHLTGSTHLTNLFKVIPKRALKRLGVRGRAGLDPGMGSLRGCGGPRDRHAHLRRLGTAQRAPEEIRLRAGQGRGGGKGSP
jgi:hypothetical protein